MCNRWLSVRDSSVFLSSLSGTLTRDCRLASSWCDNSNNVANNYRHGCQHHSSFRHYNVRGFLYQLCSFPYVLCQELLGPFLRCYLALVPDVFLKGRDMFSSFQAGRVESPFNVKASLFWISLHNRIANEATQQTSRRSLGARGFNNVQAANSLSVTG